MNNQPAIIGGDPLIEQEAGIVRPSIADLTTPELMQRIQQVLLSNQVTNGINVRQLEEEMAAYLGVDQVVAVSSCTLGLTLAIQAAGIAGKEVITSSFSIAATANAAYWNRCPITFADIDVESFDLSPEHVAELISERTGAILPVHVFGNPCRIEEIQAIASRYGVPVVYDAAQAFGSRASGVKLGGSGKFEVFSGSATKHFTSMEGGYVATNDRALADMLRLTRNYGVLPNYDCVVPGLNARMPEINAVVGRTLLPHIEEFVDQRNHHAAVYKDLLGELPGVRFQQITLGCRSSYNYFGMIIEPEEFGLTNRELASALKAEHVGTKIYFHPPIHQQQAYRSESRPALPNTEYLADRVICLPMYNTMSEALLEQISTSVSRIQHHHREVRRAVAAQPAASH